jgi:hypothetical protein
MRHVPKEVREFLGMAMSWEPRPHPFFEKLQPGHVDKLLDLFEKENERDSRHEYSQRKYHFAYFLVGLAAVALGVWYTIRNDQPTLLAGLCSAILGFVAGFGIGKRKGREE